MNEKAAPGQEGKASAQGALGQHRAAERLLQRVDQILLRLGIDVEAAILLGETLDVEDDLLARRGEILHAEADDVDGELHRAGVELLAKAAWRPLAGFLAVGQDDNQARLRLVVEHFGGPLYGSRQRRLAPWGQSVYLLHDGPRRIRPRFESELDVALLVGPRTIGNEPHAAEAGNGWEHLGERGPHLVDAGDER